MLMLGKRLKAPSSHVESESTRREENQAYLRRFAVELNNVGTSLQLAGEKPLALKLYRSALVTALEGSRVRGVQQRFSSSHFYENDLLDVDRLQLLKFGKEQLAAALCKFGSHNEPKVQVKKQETFFLADAIQTITEDDLSDDFVAAIVIILYNLGVLEYNQGQLEVSQKLLMAAISLSEEEPHGSWVYAFLLNNLGHIYYSQGRHKDALNLFESAYRIGLEVIDMLDIQSEDEATDSLQAPINAQRFPFILYNLGYIHIQGETRNYEFAAECLRDALFDTSDDQLIFNIAVNMHRIGRFYHMKCRYEEAISVYKEVLASSETATRTKCSPIMKLFSHLLRDLAYIHYKVGEYCKAVADLSLSLHMMEEAVGRDDPLIAWLRLHNDQFLKKMENRTEAKGVAPAA